MKRHVIHYGRKVRLFARSRVDTSGYMSSTSVYPIQLRHSFKETLEIDQAMGTVSKEALNKEMSKVNSYGKHEKVSLQTKLEAARH